MPTTLEYDNDIRKLCLTLSASIDFEGNGKFLQFVEALDALQEVEPINTIQLTSPGSDYVLVMAMVSGLTIDYRLVVSGGNLSVAISTLGTVWSSVNINRAHTFSESVYVLIRDHGLITLDVDYF